MQKVETFGKKKLIESYKPSSIPYVATPANGRCSLAVTNSNLSGKLNQANHTCSCAAGTGTVKTMSIWYGGGQNANDTQNWSNYDPSDPNHYLQGSIQFCGTY